MRGRQKRTSQHGRGIRRLLKFWSGSGKEPKASAVTGHATGEPQNDGAPSWNGLKRRIAFALICFMWPCSFVLVLGFAYGWWRTLGMTRRFIQAGSLALELSTEDSQGVVEKLLRLDISTMSALVFLL